MKALIETTGHHGLFDVIGGQRADCRRPSVVVFTGFFQERQSIGQVRTLCATLRDEATDAEFVGYLAASDGDMELAVSSFIAAFGTEDKTPVSKKAGTRRGAPAREEA